MLYPEVGHGALQRSRNLLLELAKKHEVVLLSYYRKVDINSPEDLDKAKSNLKKYCHDVVFLPFPSDRNIIIKIMIFVASLLMAVPYSSLLYRSRKMSNKILELEKEHNIDLVHADTIGLAEGVLKHITCKKVLNHHNYESAMMFRRADKEKNYLKKTLFNIEAKNLRKYEEIHCPKYDLNIFVSEQDRGQICDDIENIYTAVISNGVDCAYYTHHLRSNDSTGLIFSGQLDWYPNSDAMVFFMREVWPKLKASQENITLTIIGKNAQPDLLALVENDNNVQMTGYVPDLREYIQKARIFICPINDGGGTRLKILDALAQGIPVVSSPIGCEGIDVTDGENILIAKDIPDYIEKITLLLSDIDLCNKLSVSGRALVENRYSFAFVGGKMSLLYEELIS